MISIVIISKDEPGIDDTLTAITAQAQALQEPSEIVVVDASDGRLDLIRRRHEPAVRWVQFRPPPGVRVSIPHQRNAGVRSGGWGDHRLHRRRLLAGARMAAAIGTSALPGRARHGRAGLDRIG